MANPCSAVFQAGGLVVVLVEVSRKQYLASIVPVIVNAILNEHQIVVDIVAFVAKGDFPRSRLGEKQRGKILANWVTRKLRTIAQFAIRDVDAAVMGEVNSPGGVAMEPRASMVSVQSGGAGAGAGVPSLRNMEQAAPPQILEQEEHEYPAENRFSFMPAPRITNMADAADPSVATGDYHGVADAVPPQSVITSQPPAQLVLSHTTGQGFDMPDLAQYGDTGLQRKPIPAHAPPPQIMLPSVDGREDFKRGGEGAGAGDDEEAWTTEAIMHMNLAGHMSSPPR